MDPWIANEPRVYVDLTTPGLGVCSGKDGETSTVERFDLAWRHLGPRNVVCLLAGSLRLVTAGPGSTLPWSSQCAYVE
jgi:hypothetical protein